MSTNISTYVKKSKTGWELALDLRHKGDLNNSASRMYYSVFQAVLIYAVRKEKFDCDLELEKNNNVHTSMQRIVKEKMNKFYRTYADLRGLRNKADYAPVEVTASEFNQELVFQVENIKNFFMKESGI